VFGFVDGEGCFFVGVNRQPTMKVGWQVLPEFRVVQHERDVSVLEQLREFFGCGQITVNHGDRKELRIRGLNELSTRVVPFFEAHPLRTVKRSSFRMFRRGDSADATRRSPDDGGADSNQRVGWSNESRLSESSEAIRRISSARWRMRWSELHGDMQR